MENQDIDQAKIEKNQSFHHSGGFWFIKIIVGILIIFFLIAVIASLGHWGKYGYSRQIVFDQDGYMKNMMNRRFDSPFDRGWSMMGKNRSNKTILNKSILFGQIARIADNKITITDNANKEQTLVTQTSTLIYSTDDKQIGIKDLKTGANINFWGTLNQDNQYEIKWIKVL